MLQVVMRSPSARGHSGRTLDLIHCTVNAEIAFVFLVLLHSSHFTNPCCWSIDGPGRIIHVHRIGGRCSNVTPQHA